MLCQLSYRGRQRARSVAAPQSGRNPAGGGEEVKFRAPERRHRRRRGRRPGVGRACRGRAERQRGRAAGRACARRASTPVPSTGSLGRRPATRCCASSGSTASVRPARSAWRRGASSASSARRSSASGSSRAGASAGTSPRSSSASAPSGFPRSAWTGGSTRRPRLPLRRFQRARGLTPDGIAGAKTFRALVRGRSSTTTARRAAIVHRVRPGEGFSTIARHYGVKPASLARANGLTLRSTIVPGQRLRVPGRSAPALEAPKRRSTPAPTLVHTVQPGEGFIAIAQRYGVRATVLANANGLTLDERHRPGSAAAHSGPPRDGRGGTFVREPGAASPSHGRGRRELLLDLTALPRQPVATRAGERACP